VFLERDGLRIRYEILGEGEDAVFFLNGIFMRYESWYNIVSDLSKDFKVVLHDFKCQWFSDCPDDVSFDEHCDDIVALMDHLSVEKAHIVGTSYGGEVGILFASKHIERVKSLTVISSTSEIDEDMYNKALRWREGAKSKDPRVFTLSWLTDVYSSEFLEKNKGILNVIVERLEGFNYEGAVKLIDAFLDLKEKPLTLLLDKIDVPTLIVFSLYDRIKPPPFSFKIHRGIRDSLLIGLPSGHASVVERPRELSLILRGFLKSIP